MHKKKLAHLDIKPANIFVAFCEPEDVAASPVVPFRLAPDSGAGAQENHMYEMCICCQLLYIVAASQGDGDGAFGEAATTYGPTPDTVR